MSAHPTTGLRQGKKRRMKKFMINELSAVDIPAQEGARALLLKRAKVEKHYCSYCEDDAPAIVLLTSVEDGHSHAVWLHPGMRGGETSFGLIPDTDSSHDHPWILDGTGQLTIGENNGHAHTVDQQQIFEMIMTQKSHQPVLVSSAKLWDDYAIKVIDPNKTIDPEDEMPEPTTEQLSALKALKTRADAADAAEAKAARAIKVAELTDAQKVHFKDLDEAGQTEYLGKTADERQAVITKAGEADPVVYTDSNGDEFRKSDDPRLVKMAKERDADRKRIAKVESERSQDKLEKRAGETLPNLPGDLKVRAAVLKALDGIENEDLRKSAHESIVAGDTAIKAAFDSLGTQGSSVETDAEKELDRKAHELAKKDGIDYYTAYDKVAELNPELAKRAIEGSN